jgi:phage shock protein E
MIASTVIDLRSKEAFDKETYPLAINIPYDELLFNLDEIAAMEKPVMVCCETGKNSRMAVHLLSSSGISEVMDGGPFSKLKKGNIDV